MRGTSSVAELMETLSLIEMRASEDTVKSDLEMTCTRCTGVICDVEAEDTLDVLVRTANGHLEDCEGFPCKHCGHEVFHVKDEGWVAPDAGTDREGGDGMWRDVCPDNHTEPGAPHVPEMELT